MAAVQKALWTMCVVALGFQGAFSQEGASSEWSSRDHWSPAAPKRESTHGAGADAGTKANEYILVQYADHSERCQDIAGFEYVMDQDQCRAALDYLVQSDPSLQDSDGRMNVGAYAGNAPPGCYLVDRTSAPQLYFCTGTCNPDKASVDQDSICVKSSSDTSATGDPHLQNIHGERFDLMQPGVHVLLQIPRHAAIDETLLTVQADASRTGGNCEEIYFETVNVTGAWANKAQAGEVRFDANSGGDEKPKWSNFGPVALKVAHGRTEQGTKYLNVYVKHLGRAGFAVGGLLGEDDHEDASTPPAGCIKRLGLDMVRSHFSSRGSSAASTAEGILA